jgi:hypothetical protein
MKIRKTVEKREEIEVTYSEEEGTFLDFVNGYMNLLPWDGFTIDACAEYLKRDCGNIHMIYEPVEEESTK